MCATRGRIAVKEPLVILRRVSFVVVVVVVETVCRRHGHRQQLRWISVVSVAVRRLPFCAVGPPATSVS